MFRRPLGRDSCLPTFAPNPVTCAGHSGRPVICVLVGQKWPFMWKKHLRVKHSRPCRSNSVRNCLPSDNNVCTSTPTDLQMEYGRNAGPTFHTYLHKQCAEHWAQCWTERLTVLPHTIILVGLDWTVRFYLAGGCSQAPNGDTCRTATYREVFRLTVWQTGDNWVLLAL